MKEQIRRKFSLAAIFLAYTLSPLSPAPSLYAYEDKLTTAEIEGTL